MIESAFCDFIREEARNIGYQEGRNAGMKAGLEKGMQAGIIEGNLSGKPEIARNLLFDGFDINLIIKLTGLTKEQPVKAGITDS